MIDKKDVTKNYRTELCKECVYYEQISKLKIGSCKVHPYNTTTKRGNLPACIKNFKKREEYIMNKEEILKFTAIMGEFLDLPAFVCEVMEAKLEKGKYEEVCKYIVKRKKELEESNGND